MIRTVVNADLSRIAEIIIFGKRTSYRKIFKNDSYSFNVLKVVDTFNEFQCQPDSWINMLVYDDGIVKGVINYINLKNSICELIDFYVDPFFTGEGIGKLLLKAFLDNLKEKKINKIELWVLDDNIVAKKLYEKYDFIATGKKRYIEGTKVLDVEYVKYLDENSVVSETNV